MRSARLSLISSLLVLLFASAAHADILHHWTQLTGGKAQSFRAIVIGSQCPAITLNGIEKPMQVRARATAEFPNLVCEFVTSESITSARLGESKFPLRPDNANQILIIGDTGCRLKKGDPVQACNDTDAWPFATVARSVAAKEADIAIHVGDYHYREMECPDPNECGLVYGNNWQTWETDFFAPAQVMLSAHPFVFIRGDHENCERAWYGFLRYLAAEPIRTPVMCDNYEASFVVDIDDLQMAVLDSSTRYRAFYTWDRLRAMRRQFMDIMPELDRETLLLTHAPLWGYGAQRANATQLDTLETIQREAFAHMIPRLVSAVIAGDLHFAQIVSTPENPVQITFGNGGVAPYTTPKGRADNLPVGINVIGDVFGYNQFGFGLLDRTKNGLHVTLFDKNGMDAAKCDAPAAVDTCAVD